MKKKNTMRKLLRYLKKYWLLLILSLLFAALTVAMTLYLPILIGQAVDLIVAPGQVEFSTIARLLINMGILIGATALSQWIMNACNNRITYRTVRDIRSDAFARLEILPLRYIDAHSYGEIVSRMIADLEQEWGVTLPARGKAGVVLTGDGARLLPHARALCAEYARHSAELDALHGRAHISAATRQFLRYLDRRNALEVPAGCTGFDNQA